MTSAPTATTWVYDFAVGSELVPAAGDPKPTQSARRSRGWIEGFRAIFRAVRERTGGMPRVEIMIPLVAYARELELARDIAMRAVEEVSRPARSHATRSSSPSARTT